MEQILRKIGSGWDVYAHASMKVIDIEYSTDTASSAVRNRLINTTSVVVASMSSQNRLFFLSNLPAYVSMNVAAAARSSETTVHLVGSLKMDELYVDATVTVLVADEAATNAIEMLCMLCNITAPQLVDTDDSDVSSVDNDKPNDEDTSSFNTDQTSSEEDENIISDETDTSSDEADDTSSEESDDLSSLEAEVVDFSDSDSESRNVVPLIVVTEPPAPPAVRSFEHQQANWLPERTENHTTKSEANIRNARDGQENLVIEKASTSAQAEQGAGHRAVPREFPSPPQLELLHAPLTYGTMQPQAQPSNAKPTSPGTGSKANLVIRGTCDICVNDHVPLFAHAKSPPHSCCLPCCTAYLFQSIESGQSDIACPQNDCDQQLKYVEIKLLLSKESVGLMGDQSAFGRAEAALKRLEDNRKMAAYRDIPFLLWCSNPDCLSAQEHADQNEDVPFECRLCRHRTCSVHGLPFRPKRSNKNFEHVNAEDGVFCCSMGQQEYEFSQRKSSYELKFSNDGQLIWPDGTVQIVIKKCPKCGEGIEKNEGCRHMTCATCRHEFFWCCLRAYRDREESRLHLKNCD